MSDLKFFDIFQIAFTCSFFTVILQYLQSRYHYPHLMDEQIKAQIDSVLPMRPVYNTGQ